MSDITKQHMDAARSYIAELEKQLASLQERVCEMCYGEKKYVWEGGVKDCPECSGTGKLPALEPTDPHHGGKVYEYEGKDTSNLLRTKGSEDQVPPKPAKGNGDE